MITMKGLILFLSAMLFTRLSTDLASINTLSSSPLKDEEIYSLNGQRVSNTSKGIYIKNGKKVIL